MERSERRVQVVRDVVAVAHVAVGVAALVFASVLVYTGLRPNAELEGVLGPVGAFFGLLAWCFLISAVRAFRESRRGTSSTSVILSIVELVVGLTLAVGVVRAAAGYLTFEPWRSPLLPPSIVLICLGLAGLAQRWRRTRPFHRPA